MRKILFFTHHLKQGGAEKVVCALSEYINANIPDYSAYICVVYDDPELHARLKNVIVMKTRSLPDYNKIHKGFNVLRQIFEMRALKKRYGFDVCISFLPGADIINALSYTGEKRIVSVRSYESANVRHWWTKLYYEIPYHLADRIVAVSRDVEYDLKSFFHVPENKLCTITNAVEPGRESLPFTDGFPEFIKNRRVIISAGRLHEVKRQDVLIKAFGKVHRQDRSTCLVILGEGEHRGYLESVIREEQLEDAVLLPGFRDNIADYLKRSDLFVLSSRIEGMPNVLLEAMSCGLPVISTDCGTRSLLAPDTPVYCRTNDIDAAQYGVLVPVDDTERLAAAITLLFEDSALYKQYADRYPDYISRFSMASIVEQWKALIESCQDPDASGNQLSI